MATITFAGVDLHTLLSQRSVAELRKLAAGFYIKGVSKKKKAELIAEITLALQEPERLRELLLVIDKDTWSLFKTAATTGHATVAEMAYPQYRVLESLCYIYCAKYDSGSIIYLPQEVRDVFTELCEDGFLQQKERYDLLHMFVQSAINLYGIIEQGAFVDLFNHYNEVHTSVDELFPCMIRHIAVDASYCLWEEYIVSDEFEENEFEDVKDLILQIGDKPRFIPEREEFLRYSDFNSSTLPRTNSLIWPYYNKFWLEAQHPAGLSFHLMPRSSFQKLKIIYIMEYLLKSSDEDHAVTTSQIIAYLKSHDITAERKTIYSDIEALRDFGLDIIQVSEGNNHGYYVASRDFELPELKLLVDSVQSSKFITHKKTLSLIKKIEKLASIHSAQLLNRQVFVKNRIKTMNESIYYNVDEIHNGISSNRKIRFLYFEYNVAKERVYRHGGAYYLDTPEFLWILSRTATIHPLKTKRPSYRTMLQRISPKQSSPCMRTVIAPDIPLSSARAISKCGPSCSPANHKS